MKEEEGNILVAKRRIVLDWDDVKHDVEVVLKPEDFPNFEFILAVLEIAKLKTQNLQRMAQINQMQQAQVQAGQEAALAQQLNKNHRVGRG